MKKVAQNTANKVVSGINWFINLHYDFGITTTYRNW
jgi:hypothetical protein